MEKYDYKLIDINGKILQSGSNIASQESINLEPFPEGTYFLQLENEQRQTIVKKIIKR